MFMCISPILIEKKVKLGREGFAQACSSLFDPSRSAEISKERYFDRLWCNYVARLFEVLELDVSFHPFLL